MSGLRAISPADDSTESHYVKSIRSVCSMHAIPVGSPQHLAAFLKSLESDKLLAMEFWSMVARLSDESTGLSISAMNGVVIEVVMQAVTGRSVAEMVAAGREPRRLVGELGCLLAGEDLNSPIELPPPEAIPTLVTAADTKFPAVENKSTDSNSTNSNSMDSNSVDSNSMDIDKLRADVESLKAAFEAQFGMEAARASAPFTPARVEHEQPAALLPPPTAKAIDPTPASPETSVIILPDPSVAPAPKPPSGVARHSVYAEARELSSGQRASWSEPQIAPLPLAVVPDAIAVEVPVQAPPVEAAPVQTPPEPQIITPPQQPVQIAIETAPPAKQDLPVPQTQQQSSPAPVAAPAAKVIPIPLLPAIPAAKKPFHPIRPDAVTDLKPKLEVKPLQSASIHAMHVAETDPVGPESSSKRMLMVASLVLLAGVGLSAPWWFKTNAAKPANTTLASGATGPASDGAPIPSVSVPAPAPGRSKSTAASSNLTAASLNPATANRTPEKTTPKTTQNTPEAAPETAKVAETLKTEPPQPTPAAPAANIGSAKTLPQTNTAAAPATEIKTAPTNQAARPATTSATLQPTVAAANNAPAPVIRVPPTPLQSSIPQSVSSGIMEGAKIAGQNPAYPAFAKSAHISGSVVLHAIISKAGTVENLKVVSGPLTLQQSAVTAVKTWKYKPYLLNGQPTEVDTSIVVNFHLVD
ncbi:hypothetical protein BH10ACI4_BH10ACI4_03860 [soil metagenome]